MVNDKKIQYINRDKSVISGKKNLEHLKTFTNFPIYIGCTDQPATEDKYADLSISICRDTGILQLDKVLPPNIVYGDYHSEALGGVWTEHHNSFVKFVEQYSPKNILEIGGSNGYIAKKYMDSHPEVSWIMVEPAPSTDDPRIKVIKQNFDQSLKTSNNIDAIIHSHTFEHMYDPAAFIKAVASKLPVGGYHIFTLPNLQEYIKRKFANWMNFEHTVFLSEFYVDYFMRVNGFEILEKKYYNEHSIFYATKRVLAKTEIEQDFFEDMYQRNKVLFFDFIKHYEGTIEKFNQNITNFDGETYLFGAHVFSQYLIHNGLSDNITAILDNSLLKHDKRLYGTSFMVKPLEVIKNKKKVAVVLNAGAYQEEVRNQLHTINPNCIIWE